MAALDYPDELLVTAWDKLKVGKEADRGLGEALKKLQRLHAEIDAEALSADGVDNPAALDRRAAALKASEGAVKAVREQAQLVAKLVEKMLPELKKAPALKPAATFAGKAGDAATAHAAAVAARVAATSEALARLRTKFAEAAAAADDGGGDFRAFAKARVQTALKAVRRNDPKAPPTHFLLVQGDKHAVAFLGPSVSRSMIGKLSELLEKRGSSSFKPFQGTCVWEQNAYTFVGDNLPLGGLAARLKEGLLNLTGVKLPVRLRNADGTTEGAADDGDDDGIGDEPDAKPVAKKPTAATGGASPTPGGPPADAAALKARLVALQDRIAAALKGANGAAVRDLAAKAGELLKSGALADAAKLIQGLEQRLPGGSTAFDEAAFRVAWQKARDGWTDAIETVDAQIARLQARLRDEADEDLAEIAEFGLPALTGDFKAPMMAAVMDVDRTTGEGLPRVARRARALAASFAEYLDEAETVAVTDDNDFGVTVTIRQTIGGALRQLEQTLAAAG